MEPYNEKKDKDYIHFGNFCLKELDRQAQHGFYMLKGLAGYPVLGEGLRLKGKNEWDYYTLYIHKDDAEIFKQRIKDHERVDYEY